VTDQREPISGPVTVPGIRQGQL